MIKRFLILCMTAVVIFVPVKLKKESETIEAELTESYVQSAPSVVQKSETTVERSTEIESEVQTEPEKQIVPFYDIPLDFPMQSMVKMCCEKWELDPLLVYAVIQVESGFNPDAYNSGNYGLMQINQIVFEQYCVENPFSPSENISVGIQILGNYFQKYGSEEMALMAYNQGEGGAARMWKQGVYSSAYVEKVMIAKSQISEKEVGR